MKKIIAAALFMTICLFSLSAYAKGEVTMYAPDGREITVSEEDVEAYKKVGWYDDIDDVTKTMYSRDGREKVVFLDEVEAYKKVGWYDNIDDVTKTLYSRDGREKVVFIDDVEAYKKVGWYDNKADVTKIMYSRDGRNIVVFLDDVEAYKKVGWYDNKADVTKTLYSRDGREKVVFLDDVEAYKKVGWYDNKDDVTKTLYARDGREKVVFLDDVEAYKNVGWYDNKADVTKTLYSADGREIVVFLDDVEAYKNVGWYENKSDTEAVTLYSADGREISVIRAQVDDYKKVGWYDKKSDIQKVQLYSADGKTITVIRAQVEDYKKVGWSETKPVQKPATVTAPKMGKVDPSKPMIAITFDDGPKASTTPIVLDVLQRYGARATFFVQGINAAGNPALLRRMNSLGCQIASHTYNHPNLVNISDSDVAYQINTTDNIIKNIVGYKPTVIRPPYGSHNQRVRNIANRPFILWSVDTLDWKYRDANYVSNYVLSHASDGAVILLHDIHATTAQASKTFIPALINKGYQLVTVDELAYYKGYQLRAGNAYNSFR